MEYEFLKELSLTYFDILIPVPYPLPSTLAKRQGYISSGTGKASVANPHLPSDIVRSLTVIAMPQQIYGPINARNHQESAKGCERTAREIWGVYWAVFAGGSHINSIPISPLQSQQQFLYDIFYVAVEDWQEIIGDLLVANGMLSLALPVISFQIYQQSLIWKE